MEALSCPVCSQEVGPLISAENLLLGSPETKIPESGDVTICQHCTAFLVFHDGKTNLMTEEDVAGLSDFLRQSLVRMRRLLDDKRTPDVGKLMKRFLARLSAAAPDQYVFTVIARDQGPGATQCHALATEDSPEGLRLVLTKILEGHT